MAKLILKEDPDLIVCISINNEDAYGWVRCKDDSFNEHLKHEFPSGKDFKQLAETEPFELIKLLKLLAQRGTFKGWCKVCNEW